jgi:F0F1-type ATP synthase alpha subunit
LADTFVDSIETITSQEKEVLVKDKETGKTKIVMAKVWNKTVANLTLLALGSSGMLILVEVTIG